MKVFVVRIFVLFSSKNDKLFLFYFVYSIFLYIKEKYMDKEKNQGNILKTNLILNKLNYPIHVVLKVI